MENWTFTFGMEKYLAHRPDDQPLDDFIREWAYVLWELEPCDPDWRKNLYRDRFTALFDFCGAVRKVEIDKVNHLITVWEG